MYKNFISLIILPRSDCILLLPWSALRPKEGPEIVCLQAFFLSGSDLAQPILMKDARKAGAGL